jgi:hypothetical protein
MPQKRIVRKAVPADYPEIYRLQNSPNRDQAFDTPLAPYDSYVKTMNQKIESGAEIYYVMEADSKVVAFLWFNVIEGRLWGNFWGRWIKTLFLAAGKIAFEILKYPRIYFLVRRDNERVINYYEERGVRKIGETQGIYVRENDMIVAVSNAYEVTLDEYNQMVPPATEQSLDMIFEGLPAE